MEQNKVKIRHILFITLMLGIIVIAGTFAWLSFHSKDTAMVLTIDQIDNVRITLSPYQIKSNMGSVLDYSSGTVTNIEAINNSSSSKKIKLYYKINTIDSNLAISSFKYTITRSSTKNGTYSTYGTEGNFNGATSNSEKVILEETLESNEIYYYKVYICLDGNNDVSSASGKVFNAELRADILEHTVTLNANGGTIPAITGWTVNGSTATKQVEYNSTYGNLPTPIREGYTFLGWKVKTYYRSTSSRISGTSDYIAAFNYGPNRTKVGKIIPGYTYTIYIDSIEVVQGNPAGFTVYAYDYTSNSILDRCRINDFICGSCSIVYPANANTSHDLSIIVYNGIAGSTTGNSINYNNFYILEGNEISSLSTVNKEEDHTLVALWKAN